MSPRVTTSEICDVNRVLVIESSAATASDGIAYVVIINWASVTSAYDVSENDFRDY